MSEYLKPPIGVEPHWIAIPQRIKALSGAIERHVQENEVSPEYKQIAIWAEEMKMLAQLEIRLLNIEGEKQ